MELAGPGQARLADITCIRTGEGFLYPSLLTDLRSRKTVGFHAGDTLESEGAVRALETACRNFQRGRSLSAIRTGNASTARAGMLKNFRITDFRQA
jgi:hypothetical protein